RHRGVGGAQNDAEMTGILRALPGEVLEIEVPGAMRLPHLFQSRLAKVIGRPPRDVRPVGVYIVGLPVPLIVRGAETLPPKPDEIVGTAPEAAGLLVQQLDETAVRGDAQAESAGIDDRADAA